MSKPSLIQALDDGARNIYIYGEPPLLIDRAVRLAEEWGSARCGLPAFNHSRARATDERASDVLSAARTLPMMADLRVVVLRDLERGDEALMVPLLDYLADPSPSTLLILVAGPFGKVRKGEKAWGTRLLNASKKAGYVEKCSSGGVDRVRFIQEHAGSMGATIERRSAELLVDRVGDDLGRLAREVEKLAIYVGNAPIGPDDLREVCSALAEEEVWELTTGIAQRDAEIALRALHRLLEDANEPHYLLAMVVMQLRKVLRAVQMVEQRKSDRDIGRELRLRFHEVKRVRALAGDTRPAADLMDRLVRANRHMNSHRAGPARVLEALVVELCTT